MTRLSNTIAYIKRCQDARQAGYPVYLKTDPAWLVNMAINRRAGWPESRFYFGGCQPINGQYPKRADECHDSTRLLARNVNTPRLIVRETECPKRYRTRLQHRFFTE